MSNTVFQLPLPKNEPIFDYAPGSTERKKIDEAIRSLKAQEINIASIINGKHIYGKEKLPVAPPHDLKCKLGDYAPLESEEIKTAITGALATRKQWADMPWVDRAHIFLKAAELLATKYRYEINAATMLGQSKTVYQAEIDSACELIDFLRFNVYYLNEIYKRQPLHHPPVYNRLEYRPLEGFVLAVTPFNFTAIGGNLAIAPAMCGNVVIWKPSYTQVYSAWVIMKVLKEAGLPDGVIQFVVADGPSVSEQCIPHPYFAGLHFTGSTTTFNLLWKNIAEALPQLKNYPRIVGETGGKDFILVHPTADINTSVTALIRGAYEFQGQKCSAASRAYIPKSLSKTIIDEMKKQMSTIKMGSVEDYKNFVSAVIDKKSFDRIASYIDKIKNSPDAKIIHGGELDDSTGYFVSPTLVEASNPKFLTMCEEIFGPVLTYYVYDDNKVDEVLTLIDETSAYALTGSVIARDRNAIQHITARLNESAGNFYINDKPTGAVVGQQPFGGARKSGTNDKAGSELNLLRWISPRTIKEATVAAEHYSYPFMD